MSNVRWHCTNSECHQTRIAPAAEPPVCSCGTPMKRDYKRPVLRYLDFLREPDESSEPLHGATAGRSKHKR